MTIDPRAAGKVHAYYPRTIPQFSRSPSPGAATSIKQADILHALIGSQLFGAGAGNYNFAVDLVNSMSSSLTYPLSALANLGGATNTCAFGRVGAVASGVKWTYESVASCFYSYIEHAGKSDQKWWVMPMDITPENIAMSFALYQATNGQAAGVIDLDGYGQGTPSLDVLKFEDFVPIAPAVLYGGHGGNQSTVNTTITFDGGSPAAIDALSRSIASQTPQGFPPQFGVMTAWGGTASAMAGMSSIPSVMANLQGNLPPISTCMNVGAYIAQSPRTSANVKSYLTQTLGMGNVSLVGPGALEVVKFEQAAGRYRGRAKIHLPQSGQPGKIFTVYFDNANLTVWSDTNDGAVPFGACLGWYSESQHRPFLNSDIAAHGNEQVSLFIMGTMIHVPPNQRRAAAIARALGTVGYAGAIY